jgi:hypothetical protein
MSRMSRVKKALVANHQRKQEIYCDDDAGLLEAQQAIADFAAIMKSHAQLLEAADQALECQESGFGSTVLQDELKTAITEARRIYV